MKSNNEYSSKEYQKAIDFLEKGCNCGCSSRILKEEFAALRESFQALSKDHLHYNARQEEEAKDLLKRFKEHLFKAKSERNYYNKNTKLAEEQRKSVNQNYFKDYWHKEDLKELINENEDKPVEVAMEVIEKWEKDAKDFTEALDIAEE
ncbi:18012_t:CDS:2 [Funneliformis geosporum]|nr:18012_t:CDS:2 [Funneliformis geosporum]